MRSNRKSSTRFSPFPTQLQRKAGAAPSLCACGLPAITVVRAELLGGVAAIEIGACRRHDPPDEATAYAMIRAILAGIAKAGAPVAEEKAGPTRRGGRRV